MQKLKHKIILLGMLNFIIGAFSPQCAWGQENIATRVKLDSQLTKAIKQELSIGGRVPALDQVFELNFPPFEKNILIMGSPENKKTFYQSIEVFIFSGSKIRSRFEILDTYNIQGKVKLEGVSFPALTGEGKRQIVLLLSFQQQSARSNNLKSRITKKRRAIVLEASFDGMLRRHELTWILKNKNFKDLKSVTRAVDGLHKHWPCPKQIEQSTSRSGPDSRQEGYEIQNILKCYVEKNDVRGFAKLVRFPMKYLDSNGTFQTMRSEKQFIDHYNEIMTSDLKKALLEAQNGLYFPSYWGKRIGRAAFYVDEDHIESIFNLDEEVHKKMLSKLNAQNKFLWLEVVSDPQRVYESCRTSDATYVVSGFSSRLVQLSVWRGENAQPKASPPDDVIFGLNTAYGTCGTVEWSFFSKYNTMTLVSDCEETESTDVSIGYLQQPPNVDSAVKVPPNQPAILSKPKAQYHVTITKNKLKENGEDDESSEELEQPCYSFKL